MTVGEPHPEIRALLNAYFTGLYTGDVEALRELFHPAALYATASSGELLSLDLPAYLQVVARRPKPHTLHERRPEHIDRIEVLGPYTAFAQVRCSMTDRDYTDLLSLIHVDGHWQIVAKVFHYDLLRSPATQTARPDLISAPEGL